MPTYEYTCSKCGHQFEKFQMMSDKPLTVCPRELCRQKRWGRGKVKRGISAGAGLIFKGSGFYLTDYRSESYKEAAKKDTPAAAPAAAGDGKAGVAKSGAKSTASPEKKPAKAKSAEH